MSKTSYKNAGELVDELFKKIAKLNAGTLDLNELDVLVSTSRDLYEQLVVLRYKAFDTFGTPQTIPSQIEPNIGVEIMPNLEPEKEVQEEKQEEAIFDFSGITEAPKVQPEIIQPAFNFEVEPQKKEEKISTPLSTLLTEKETVAENPTWLNESLKKEEDQTLRKKLENTPITDIKTHISIAKKFEYISAMFSGNARAYEDAIDFLNTCGNAKDAQLKINELVETYKWDLEDKSILKFTELVERRYL